MTQTADPENAMEIDVGALDKKPFNDKIVVVNGNRFEVHTENYEALDELEDALRAYGINPGNCGVIRPPSDSPKVLALTKESATKMALFGAIIVSNRLALDGVNIKKIENGMIQSLVAVEPKDQTEHVESVLDKMGITWDEHEGGDLYVGNVELALVAIKLAGANMPEKVNDLVKKHCPGLDAGSQRTR